MGARDPGGAEGAVIAPALIHLDTSFLVRALIPGTPQDRDLRSWLASGSRLAMSAVAWSEFLCGPVRREDVERAGRLVRERVGFDFADAELAAELFNAAGRRRGTHADCMIAAAAVRRDCPLATANPGDFRELASAGLVLLG